MGREWQPRRNQSSSSSTGRSMFASRPFGLEKPVVERSLFSSRPFSPPDVTAGKPTQPNALPGYSYNFALMPLNAPEAAAPVQAKLTVGQPNDPYEQEADQMAEQVMNMPEPAPPPSLQRETISDEDEEVKMKPLADSITPLLQRSTRLEEEEPVQPKQSPAPDTQPSTPSLESRLTSSEAGGSPLPNDVRSFMEPRFGADLRQVRVHTGSDAVQMSQDLNAEAFTHKQNIFFGVGKAPAKDTLTAHELTHVVQQTGAVQTKPLEQTVQRKCSACAKEDQVQRSLAISSVPIANLDPTLQRQTGEDATAEPTLVPNSQNALINGNCGPGTTDPFCLPLPPADANTPCKPFPNPIQAMQEWERLNSLIPQGSATATSCDEVKPVWETYFAGNSTSVPIQFANPSSCVVDDAKTEPQASPVATFAAEICFRGIIQHLPITLQDVNPTPSPFGGPVAELQLPLNEAIGPRAPLFVHPNIEYGRDAFNAAANLAGGVGRNGNGSDVFGDDDRVMEGTVIVEVKTVDPISGVMSGNVKWQPHVHVQDTVDFCPGNLGNFWQEGVTVPMSKLESMGLTRDVPITIDYDLDDIQQADFNVKPLIGSSPPPTGSTPPITVPPSSIPPQSDSQFRSQRFGGQPTLEACGQDQHRMLRGENDTEAVRKVQETLVEAGIPVNPDGIFGAETEQAVAKFKREHSPQLVPSDGVVGPKTSHALDDVAVEHGQ